MTATKTRKWTPKTAEEREAEVKALHDKLNDAISEVASSDDWATLLKYLDAFHNYSFGNKILIAIQKPEATHVAGYRAWEKLGRHVVAGEKGIKILRPNKKWITAKDKDDSELETRIQIITGWGVATVFDISQTDGDPVPEQPSWVTFHGDAPADLWDNLSEQVTSRGFTLVKETPESGAHGDTNYTKKRVRVRDDVDDAEALRILAHELGHIVADHENRRISRDQRETEADSIAYIVLAALGFDISASTTQYVVGWSQGDAKVIHEALQAVQAAANTILANVPGATEEEEAA